MPRRIAVLGGGCGSMAAVWALTQLPNWRDRFDITVYQVGWRLGGKCASGRDETIAWRIYEHGLHIWGGFYQNAFRLMQQVYAALPHDPGNPLGGWDDALKKISNVILQENINGRLINWELDIPENDDVPGTPGVIPSAWAYIKMIIAEIRSRMAQRVPPPVQELLTARVSFVLQSLEFTSSGASIFPRLFPTLMVEGGTRPHLDNYQVLDILDAAKLVDQSVPSVPRENFVPRCFDVLHLIEEAARLFIERHTVPGSDLRRRAEFILNFVVATVRGLISDNVIFAGWEAINHIEWSEWLRRNGALPETLSSALVRGIYDYVFGFVKGQPNNRQLEAGTGTHGVLRLFFTFKGAIFWEMQAGMGDVVFAPLYEVLKSRGVRFEFFSKVKKLVVKNDLVDSIEMEQQATVKSGDYDPLVIVGGVHAWPAHPRYEQLVQGDALRKNDIDLESHWTLWTGTGTPWTLRRGTDFDDVILGISVGALREIAGDVAKVHAGFDTMLNQLQTVQTHSMQLWLDGPAQRLGAPIIRRCTTAAAEPIATWCDMSYLLQREQWPPQKAPLYLAYFCGELEDVAYQGNNFPQYMLQYFRKIAVDWLKNNTGSIWSRATLPGSQCLDWSLLHDPQNRAGQARLDAQYLRVNINPSDRYVASFPGTSRYRLPADQPVLPNLFIAGDWVKTPINAGCVEAAVMAGLYAARAVSGEPIDIIGG